MRGGENTRRRRIRLLLARRRSDADAAVFETTYYFAVRARDRQGNEDTNAVEREGLNVCE
jgi:hypothetical protein